MRVAAGRLETAGAEVGGAEVDVATEGVELGELSSGVEVGVDTSCVRLAKGVTACRVCANVVEMELAEGTDVTEPPQATVAKMSTAAATIDKVYGLNRLIFSPCHYRYYA
jgi:hypothetical protein